MQKIDDVQRAAIRRAEVYLRKKAQAQPINYRNEFLAGVFFGLVTIGILIIGLAL